MDTLQWYLYGVPPKPVIQKENPTCSNQISEKEGVESLNSRRLTVIFVVPQNCFNAYLK